MPKLTALVLKPEPPSLKKIRAFLDSAPADEVFEVPDMVKRAGVSERIMREALRNHPELESYTSVVGPRRRYWGNPKAIKELLRMVAA